MHAYIYIHTVYIHAYIQHLMLLKILRRFLTVVRCVGVMHRCVDQFCVYIIMIIST